MCSLSIEKISPDMPEQAIVKPLPHAARSYKRSRFRSLPRIPMRMLISDRSAAGKGTLISSLVLDHYRGVFENIYIFSSTVHLDPTWQAITEYAREELGQGRPTTPRPSSSSMTNSTKPRSARLSTSSRTV